MTNITQILMSLIKNAIGNTCQLSSAQLTEEDIKALYNLSKSHDLTHLLVPPIEKNKLIENSSLIAPFQKEMYKAVYRYGKIKHELDSLRNVLAAAKITFIPLKGSILRSYYPEAWMRTSCDIDILVKKEDLDRAKDAIVRDLGYKFNGTSTHDVSLFSPSGVCLELHFELKEPEFTEPPILLDIWNSQEIASVSEYEYAMSPELFLLYHIYHMAKHFIRGGCGIKPFIDLWIIKNKMGYDEDKAVALLKENDLYEFYRGASELTDVWFEDKEHSDITREIEDYILRGGVYGTLEQQLAMSQSRKGGKFRHLLSKIFLSYDAMLIYYPSLKKCPVLFPFYQVRRWFRILFCGGSKRAFTEIRLNQNLSTLKKEKANLLLTELGL